MNRQHTNVANFLLDGKEPDRIALWLVDKEHSFGELQHAAATIGRYLLQIGGQKGDRVTLISDNSFFWVAAYLGTLLAGLICVPLPSDISPEDLDYVLGITRAGIAFVQASHATRLGENFRGVHWVTDRELPRLPFLASQKSLGSVLLAVTNGQHALPTVVPEDLAALMFTSGSTGKPRGVMVSHANIMANTESIIEYLRLTENDRMMTVLPFHYCFGTSLLHTHLKAGASLVLDSRFMYPEVVLTRMLNTQCTGFAGVPSHFQILLRSSSIRKKKFPSLRYVQQAGGHLAPSFIRELQEALPEAQVFVMYGQTEATARLSYLPPEYLDSKPESIGKGIPGVNLQVLNGSGDEVLPGEVGEIVAEGENVTRGYWRSSEESEKSFRAGRLYTGDLATVDEAGFIYVVDRAKDFLKCGGKRVSCQQLEEQLLAFGSILEAAVIGVSDQVLGEAVKAFVVPRRGEPAGLEERLRLFCREHISAQLVPRDIVVLQNLPKNTAGKVLKHSLRAL